jgi:GH24 family phage-related lysozyme (muramidase)|tara:strand:+ start:525 stop:1136 length:612 start_codon:yes stop_codon:yes gene_type:complete
MAEKGKPTPQFMKHLKSREGSVSKSYLDSLGKLTGGIGHLLSEEEKRLYPKGANIPEEVRTEWIQKDSLKAWDEAVNQAESLGAGESGEFVEALASVNFQMGTNWKKKFPSAWKALESGDYDEAIAQVEYVDPRKKEKGASAWKTQTPVRVADFVEAIGELKSYKENIAYAARDEIKKNAANTAFDNMEKVNEESDVNIDAIK